MINYPYLPPGKKFKYIDLQDEFMKAAYEAAKDLSTDLQHPTGTVLVKNGEIVASGANQAQLKNKFLQRMHNEKKICLRKILHIPSGKYYFLCPGCARSKNHAEPTVIRNYIRSGGDPKDADLYLWGHFWCCEPCWNAMINAGIRDVYLLKNSEILFDKTNPNNKIGDFTHQD